MLTVTNTNDAPTVASAIADASTNEDAAYSLNVAGTCTDVDSGDSLTYTISGAPSTITISGTTISGTPVNANVGAHTITVTCTDGSSATASDQYVLTVVNTNDAPSFTSTAVTSVNEDAAYSYTVATSDDDGDTVTVTCTTCPSWLSYSSSTGKLTGTPDNDDVGANAVVLTANDGTTTSTQSFTVTVANVNSMGSVSLSGTTAEDQALTATVTDPDGLTGVTISYQWQRTSTPGTASSWADISGATSASYTLTQSDVSTCESAFHTLILREELSLTQV